MAGLRPPLSTLRLRPRGRLRMTRGQGGSLVLSCIELSSTTPCQSPGAPCRRQYPGGITGCVSLASPVTAAFPVISPGRLPHYPFRGLLSVHSRYGLHARQVPYRTLYTRGFSHFVTSATAPVATGRSESCRAGFAPAGKQRLCTAHEINELGSSQSSVAGTASVAPEIHFYHIDTTFSWAGS